MGITVGLTYDVRSDYVLKEGDPPDANAEFDHPDDIRVIANAIRGGGYRTRMIGNGHDLLKAMKKLDADIVFNIAEGRFGRNRESQVPVILEMMGIPFVGSDGLTLGLTLDKVMAKKVLISEKIPTPRFVETSNSRNLRDLPLKYPIIVKPRYEGSSKGLNDKSVVTRLADLKKQVAWLVETYKQPALAEEFIQGREFTVAVLGNERPRALPVVQIRIDGKLNLGNLFYTFSRVYADSLDYICPAPVSKRLADKIKDVALRAYRAVDCRDFGRVDIRLDKFGIPYVLEVNPLPSLTTEDVFAAIARHRKISFDAMILRILREGLKRYGMK